MPFTFNNIVVGRGHRCRFVFKIGGMIGVPCEGAKRPSWRRVWEGGYPPPTVGTFSKIRVSKSHLRALKNDFLGN